MTDDRDEIRSKIDLLDLVSQKVALKKAGRHWKGLCPFHDDKNPSFYVSPETGRYKCWSCSESGDIFTWVMKTQHVEFVDALKMLADQAGIKISRSSGEQQQKAKGLRPAMQEALNFFQDQFGKSSHAKEYCERRGITKEVCEKWFLGYAPDIGDALASHLKRNGYSLTECKELFLVDDDGSGGYFDKFRGRLIFPIWDEKGDLVAFGGRILGDRHPKYINSSDTPLYRKSRVLYGMNQAREKIAKSRRAVLTEGYLDVIACHQAGVEEAIASLGTALSEEHAKLLKRWCDGVTILYDSDAAGQKAADRAIDILEAEGLKVRVALMDEGQDPDTLLKSQGADAVQKAIKAGLTPLAYRIAALQKRATPESEEFWSEVYSLLAKAPSEMELEKYIAQLAPLYPGLRDPMAAQRALRTQISDIRGPLKKTRIKSVQQKVPLIPATRFTSTEAIVFRALIDPALRTTAWAVLSKPQLFETEAATQLAQKLLERFSESQPQGPASQWLSELEPAEMQEWLHELTFDDRLANIHPQFLTETIESMVRKYEAREVRRLRQNGDLDDAGRTASFEQLKRLKPDHQSSSKT